eukprot:scaffold18902_cov119-Isochrysis_galbana.AAC.1
MFEPRGLSAFGEVRTPFMRRRTLASSASSNLGRTFWVIFFLLGKAGPPSKVWSELERFERKMVVVPTYSVEGFFPVEG